MTKPANFCRRIVLFTMAAGMFFLLNFSEAKARDARDFEIAAAPAWTVRIAAPAPGNSSPAASAGVAYLIFDQQLNGESDESYLHVGKHITSANGVQNGAQLEFNFDPAFQQLTIHFIHILREGKILDRLDKSKFRIVQQETGLERHLYNGELSAVLFLEDVRVGDVIDYAYTIKGANPILKGRFVDSFTLAYTMPVQKQFYRLLWTKGRKLTIKNHNTSLKPVVRDAGNQKEYVWELQDTPATAEEDSIPSSFETFAWVQLSEFASWEEVVDWAIPLYQLPSEALPPDLRQKIARWQELKNPEKKISQALRFVQDEVRYLGIEIGPNSQQPNEPGVVFDRRFGDCKDKVHLFCAILTEMGVEAHPVLVHMYNRKAVLNYAPSPYAFDHVIAQFKFDGKTIWVDPTFSYQRGPLTNLYFPNYGCGLVIAPRVNELTVIPMQQTGLPTTAIYDTFHFLNYTNPAVYEVKTVKEGLDADLMRADLADDSRADLEKSYLNHYAKLYPKIEIAVPTEIRDDEENDTITMIQTYHISDVWELSVDKQRWELEFYPENIFRLMTKPETSLRSFPLALNYPRHEKQITRVLLPQVYDITNEESSVETEAFRFRRWVSYSNRELTLKYDFENLTDTVAAAGVPDYLRSLKQARALADFSIQHSSAAAIAKLARQSSGPNWPVIILATVYTILSIIAACLLYYFRPVGNPPLILRDPLLTGIGGWLALLAIGVVLRPMVVLVAILKTAPSYSLESWQILTIPGSSAYNPNWAPLLIMELLINITLVVFAVLILILFFQKRFAFRSVFVVYLSCNIVFTIIDHLFYLTVASESHRQLSSLTPVSSTIFYGLLWILYVCRSRRVKLTFVN